VETFFYDLEVSLGASSLSGFSCCVLMVLVQGRLKIEEEARDCLAPCQPFIFTGMGISPSVKGDAFKSVIWSECVLCD